MYLIYFHQGQGILNKHTWNKRVSCKVISIIVANLHQWCHRTGSCPRRSSWRCFRPQRKQRRPSATRLLWESPSSATQVYPKRKKKGPGPLQVSGDTCKNNTGVCIYIILWACYWEELNRVPPKLDGVRFIIISPLKLPFYRYLHVKLMYPLLDHRQGRLHLSV